jgi:hypothetical protein
MRYGFCFAARTHAREIAIGMQQTRIHEALRFCIAVIGAMLAQRGRRASERAGNVSRSS